ncbi:hypothetical protein AC249_AIPGENE23803, partial [Exaiptasia diaphana]
VSTAVVQSGFIQCMGAALRGNTLLQGLEILPQLLQRFCMSGKRTVLYCDRNRTVTKF